MGKQETALANLAAEAAGCTRCPLYRNATHVVFGQGSARADMMLVGEQPGDSEDRAGLPFVGPAGRVLDRALTDAGIARKGTYVTNAVKHFKNEPRGKKRIHQRPDRYEIERCRWWLDRELEIVKPKLIVALGATAARALTGRTITISKVRGTRIALRDGVDGLVTIHPSYVLRLRDAAKDEAYAGLVADLGYAARLLGAFGGRRRARPPTSPARPLP